jgi:predicted glutamine amidotransferase
MCLLMVSMGQVPNYNHISNANINNPDGFGFAVHTGDRIITSRGMNPQKTVDKFYDTLDKAGSDFVAIYHSRITTHGDSIIENAHPFKVGGRNDIILAHNGMLPIHPKAGDRRSDTRIFAEDVMLNMGIEMLDDKHSFARLEDWAAGSKMAILSTAPELRDSVYIVNEHLGEWVDDIWWSNSSYKHAYNFYSGGYYSGGLWSTDDLIRNDRKVLTSVESDEQFYNGTELCYVCFATLYDESYHAGVCVECNSCLDCFSRTEDCMCYTPTYAVKQQGNWWNEVEA